MEFGIEKCALLIRRSRKIQITEGIELPNQEFFLKRKLTSIWEHGKQIPSNKVEMKEKEYLR